MWQIDDRSPFASLGYFVRDRHGLEHWVVALRARFEVRAGRLLAVAEPQEPVRIAPQYRDPDAQELAAEADFAPFRPRVDLTVSGSACLPEGQPAVRFDVRVNVGTFEKRARVFTERMVRVRPGRFDVEWGEPVSRVDLSWRSSLGGRDLLAPSDAEHHPFNPIGKGWTEQWQALPIGTELPMPAVEDPDRPVVPGRPLPAPHGFGPLQPSWRPRRDYAGTYDDVWRERLAPLAPEDFSEAFHQAAPADQVLDLRGGEPVEIEGLHPDGPYAFRLPELILDATTRIGAARVPGRFRLVAVALEASNKVVEMVWNASIPCHGRDHLVRDATVWLRQMGGAR
jgi:hypothetical protein